MGEKRDAGALSECVAIDSLADPVFFIDGDGRVAGWNRACEGAFGVSHKQALGQPLAAIWSGVEHGGLLALLDAPAGEIKANWLPSVRLRDRLWDIHVSPGADGGPTAIYCLPASGYPREWPELISSAADAIWAVDEEDRIIAWNRGAQELFGYTAEEIIGQPLARLIPEHLIQAREPERLRKALSELGAVRDYPTRRVAKDGQELEVSLTRTVVRNGSSGNFISSTIVRDLSQRRQIERQMVESEKLATVGQLSASLAQEIGAPLTSMRLLVEKLRRRNENPEMGRQLKLLGAELARITRLSRGLVDLAKPGELELQPLSLPELIEDTLELLDPSLRRKEIVVEVQLEAGLPVIRGDAGQLQQVFLNLLMNAERALEGAGGGHVQITGRLKPGLPLEGRPLRNVVEIQVSDDGPGIDPADLPFVFAPFFSRYGGSGLGLSLTKQIIHGHGGTVEARENPGGGATFVILLPVDSDDD